MAIYGQGFSLRSLLEDPNLQNPPNLNKGTSGLKKGGKLGGFVTNSSSAFLGSNLWDKPHNDDNNSNDFDLEYMDLDEFLSENGIPVNPDDNDESQTISLLASALARSPPRSPNPTSPGILIDPISPGNPRPVPVGDELDNLNSFSNVSSPVGQPLSPLGPVHSPPQSRPVQNSTQSVIERYLLDDDFGIKIPSPKVENKTEIKESHRKRKVSDTDYTVKSSDIGLLSIPVYQQNSPPIRSIHSVPSPHWEPTGPDFDNDDSCSADDDSLGNMVPVYQQNSPPIRSIHSVPSPHWEPTGPDFDNDDSCSADDDSLGNMVPGQEGFDPTARKFSAEELKPQPIIKKARKIFVDDHAKDDKYWQRRKKNNVAAKRSREARRVKENQIAMRAAFLEQENEKLRKSYEKIQRENENLIKRLSKYESLE